MSSINLLGLSNEDKVLANGVKGKVVSFGVDSAFIELPVTIDGSVKVIKQWYSNDALKKIETGIKPVSTSQVTPQVQTEVQTNAKVVVDTSTIEMGVPGGSQLIQKIKKGRNK
jgi:hypothetical protein